MVVAAYPELSEVMLEQRPELHARFQELPEGMSELSFAGIYLFRQVHRYGLARLDGEILVIVGEDTEPFFILPFGLPGRQTLDELFDGYHVMKCCSSAQAERLSGMGYRVWEDRDNFDYLYRRENLAGLSGRRLHRKKNLVNLFLRNNACIAKPLLEEHAGDALRVLETWRQQQQTSGDYEAAREAIEKMESLQLCGGIFYVNEEPVAYSLGEELAQGRTWATHFEKAVMDERYKGIYQHVNQAFVSVLPEKYEMINREQDLGDPGLRQAKESYKPDAFVKKYRAAR
ncbi:MAG: DUF2156 domain-containing protein [Sedimentisphaerales bacterium]|nr:DUF2156 domain-containing protein [Sedimentisphaerales bacterium]